MAEKSVLAGNLDFINLSDVFQILGGNGSTGILRITTPYVPQAGFIYFRNGDPINASNGPMTGLEAIYALFGWTDGTFEFQKEDVQIARVVKNNRMEIVLDALRMLDDGEIMKVGPPSFEEAKEGKERALPTVKGPWVDYTHVVAEEDYREGQRIVKEGGHGKWIWVILNGTVEVTRESPNGQLPISRLGEGGFIGTFEALTFRDDVRTAAVNAITNVQLGLLDTERISIEFTSLSPDFRNLLLSLGRRLKKATDRAVELFVKQDSMEGIAKDKRLIIKKGSTREEVFSIQEGQGYVIGHTPRGDLPLLTIVKDDVLGYLPFADIGHEPRSASVLASKDLKLCPLDPRAIQKEYDRLSGTFRNMIYYIAACIFVTTKRVYQLHEGK